MAQVVEMPPGGRHGPYHPGCSTMFDDDDVRHQGPDSI